MKGSDEKEIIEEWRKRKGEKFEKCVAFLKRNKERVEDFHYQATKKLVCNLPSAKERLYFLFLDCINAAGGNNLTATANGTEKFVKILNHFGNEVTISFKDFLGETKEVLELKSEISEDITKYFFEIISDGNIKNFKSKKAALFMHQIHTCQSYEELNIFSDLKPENIYKPIPLDVVIAFMCSELLKLDEEFRIDASKHFDIFNKWVRDNLEDDYYLLEDLWYWGYFFTKNNNENRNLEFNTAKYYTNAWFYPCSQEEIYLKKKFDEFAKFFE